MIEPHYCEECKLYHREHHVRAAPYPDEPEQSAQPTCNCGADRTGPSAEAHADTCPVEIYDKAVQAITDRPNTCANCGKTCGEHLLHDGNKCSLGSVMGWFPKTLADAMTDRPKPTTADVEEFRTWCLSKIRKGEL